jgi:hypothetical protein
MRLEGDRMGEGARDRRGEPAVLGLRTLEAALLARLAALGDQARADPAKLALPVRVVVPSRSLADHVGERIVAHRGRAVAGLQVQTLFALALEALDRAGLPPPPPDTLFPVVVRRLAAAEPALRDALGGLADGYASVEAAVDDLLEAGFEAAGADAVHEAIDAAARDAAVLARAHAVARVAERCLGELGRLGVGHDALTLRAAREALARDPEAALPARAVLIHGFADATGLRAELLETLVRRHGAQVWLDAPPDPADPGRIDAGARFGARLRERLRGGETELGAEPVQPPRLALLEAARPDAELREVAARVREALDAGVAPERIGIVARELSVHRASLRLHLRALGIPFSGAAPGGVGALARRTAALDALLREGMACRTDRWLAAGALAAERGGESGLRTRLRELGLLRLRALADHEPGPEAEHAVAAARATDAQLRRLTRAGTCAEQIEALELLLEQGLGWAPEREEGALLREELARLRDELPAQTALAPEELALLVRRRLARRTAVPLGGEGAGVQVLDAMQARGRSFERLFLIGLVRDAFPRSVREEPLLPDFVRERLRAVLPDLPVKREGHDEERFLFAQLVAASPLVTLSWPRANEDGRECARSSFVERLLHGRTPEAPAPRAPAARPATLHERALAAALTGARQGLAPLLPLLLRESAPEAQACGPAALAAIRTRVVAEHESGGGPAPRLGPYFGFVGAARGARDPRARPLYVTRLEKLARCGWQEFLQGFLHLRPPLDGNDALPGVGARMLGLVVHAAIAEVFRSAADAEGGVAAAWPDDAGLLALALEKARAQLVEDFVPLPELARVLASRALPYLQRARSLDAAEGARLRVLATESERVAPVPDADGTPRELHFRVDRVERLDGVERLTDYKTGRALSQAARSNTRTSDFVKAIAVGEALQPVAYAFGAAAGGSGRLLYLDPELVPEAVSFEARRDDPEIAQAFTGAFGALCSVLDTGSFYPRLLDEKRENQSDACRTCDVAQACLQNDTTARRRLDAWIVAQAGRDGAALAPAERAFLGAFRLEAGAARPSRRRVDAP